MSGECLGKYEARRDLLWLEGLEDFMAEVAFGGSLDGVSQETKIGIKCCGDRDWLSWACSQQVQ